MQYYDLCCKHVGKVVKITDCYGFVHHGRITNVTRTHVYIEPVDRRSPFGGFGYGYYGGYYGDYRPRFGYPIALAAIAGFALATAFFW